MAAVALGVVYRVCGGLFALPVRRVVQAFQRGVILREGRTEKILLPGAYWISQKRRLLTCDVRPVPFQIFAQDVVPADGIAVRVSLSGEYRIVNPASFVTESSDAFGAFCVEMRQVLRIATGELNGEVFLGNQAELTNRLKELITPKAGQLGIEIRQLEVCEAVPVGPCSLFDTV